jgi:hypothetical protein
VLENPSPRNLVILITGFFLLGEDGFMKKKTISKLNTFNPLKIITNSIAHIQTKQEKEASMKPVIIEPGRLYQYQYASASDTNSNEEF